jgi:hypothetical protein
LIGVDLALGRVAHDFIERVIGISFAATAKEASKGIAADAIFAPVTEPRSELAAFHFRMRGLALVDLALRADDAKTPRDLHFVA